MNVLVINGHPRHNSFSEALAKAYADGASSVGMNVRSIDLNKHQFELNVTHYTPHNQFTEPCITHAQQQVHWANHVVFVYPTWWGTMPALLKGFIDRVFTSGFAFDGIEGGTGYAPLLRGKTAQLITTMDTPVLVYKLVNRAPGDNAMHKTTLGFCGFEMRRALHFGPVKHSNAEKRAQWIARVKVEGTRLAYGALTTWKRATITIVKWLKAIRLQFYPMSFMAYTVGALAATSSAGFKYSLWYWLGYLWLFLLEVTTVLSNEYFDRKTDEKNRYFSPFSGGSRVIVENELTAQQVKRGFITTASLAIAVLAVILVFAPFAATPLLLTSATLFVLAMGYTIPPLRLSYHTLGEVTVGITHSAALVVTGYLLQGGRITDTLPWMISMPLFFAVLPSIILAGIPDHDADKAVGKKTIAVRLGKHSAATVSIVLTIVSVVAVMIMAFVSPVKSIFGYLLIGVVPHAAYLVHRIRKYQLSPTPRIDILLVIALSYILWFVIVPIIMLW